jgi:hypothetical protein
VKEALGRRRPGGLKRLLEGLVLGCQLGVLQDKATQQASTAAPGPTRGGDALAPSWVIICPGGPALAN